MEGKIGRNTGRERERHRFGETERVSEEGRKHYRWTKRERER